MFNLVNQWFAVCFWNVNNAYKSFFDLSYPIFPLSIQGKLFPSSLITTFISKQTEGFSISQSQQQMSFNALVQLLYLKISRMQFGKLFYVTKNIINTKMGNKSQKIWEVLWQCSLLMDHEICTLKKAFWEHSC